MHCAGNRGRGDDEVLATAADPPNTTDLGVIMEHTHPSPAEIASGVELASHAPSVHNTQPWQWRVTGDGLELFADRTRRLQASDPQGRMLMLSCGATLHHLAVAMTAMGWAPVIRRLPEPRRPSLLASITFAPSRPTSAAHELSAAITARRTDRRPMSTWEVPDNHVRAFVSIAAQYGAIAEQLASEQPDEWVLLAPPDPPEHERAVRGEAFAWTHRRPQAKDGIPPTNLPPEGALRGTRLSTVVPSDQAERALAGSGLRTLLLTTSSDDTLACLRAGEALSAILLEATRRGLATAIDTQALERQEVRDAIEQEVLHGSRTPQVVVRVGWPSSADPLPMTPRRDVDEILHS